MLIGAGLALLAGSVPALAQETQYDTDFANRISGITPQVRAQLTTIAAQSHAQMMAVFQKYGIDPNAKPNTDQLMKAANELEAVQHAERQAVSQLLQPEEMAQYDTFVAQTTQKIRDAAD